MSQLAISLKPQIISAISKLKPRECRNTSWSCSEVVLHIQKPGQREVRRGGIKALEDQFVDLLVQAGVCHKRRAQLKTRWQGRSPPCHAIHHTQTRSIGTSSGRRAAAAAAARIELNDDDDDTPQPHHTFQAVEDNDEVSKPPCSTGNLFGDVLDTLELSNNISRSRRPPRVQYDASVELRKLSHGRREAAIPVSLTVPDTDVTSTSRRRPANQATISSSTPGKLDANGMQVEDPSASLRLDSKYQKYGLELDKSEVAALPSIPRSKYQEMVDIYGMPIEEETDARTNTPSLADWGDGLGGSMGSVIQYPLAPRLTISAQDEDRAQRREKKLREALTAEHAEVLNQLHTSLRLPPGTVNQNKLWRLYCRLPSPQVYYLSHPDIDRLFRHLAWVEYKSFEGAKEKVFRLLEQCNTEGISIHRHHWTTAITLAGRWVRNIETEQVREAIETWMNMERHGIRADPVVFSVLFDVAAKAGRFALADTIHAEMKARDMTINRYFRCSMIHCAGMRKDGDAVRAAFNDFVAAGDIVDTGVMNLVVRSLIRSGEGEAAEHVFSNMKSLHAEKFPGSNAKTWQERRAFAKSLNRTAAILRKKQKQHEASFFGSQYSNKERLEELQRLTPILPDASTYRIMIGYHALVSGDIGRIQELLQEMKAEGFHVHGSVYVNVFWGFVRHGGFSFSAWTPELLEQFWLDFTAAVPYANVIDRTDTGSSTSYAPAFDDVDHGLSVMSEDDRPVHFSVIVAKNIMHAFYRCSGKGRMLRAWRDIQAKWQTMSTEEETILHSYCRKRLREHIWQDPEHINET